MRIFKRLGYHENITGSINNPKEFDAFFKGYYPVFLSFACRYLQEEEARDIVQDVFILFWERRSNFNSLLAAKAFFYRSIANRCINALKKEDIKQRYAQSVMEKMESEDSIRENIIREETSYIIHKKLKELKPREREIILLSMQNNSNQEIAEKLSISLATVKTHKMHAYQRLRKELEELRFLLMFFL